MFLKVLGILKKKKKTPALQKEKKNFVLKKVQKTLPIMLLQLDYVLSCAYISCV